MTPEQFCYWLQGRAELMPDTPPSEAEWKMIAEHLATVFKKVTPAKIPEPIQDAFKKLQDEAAKKTPPFYAPPPYKDWGRAADPRSPNWPDGIIICGVARGAAG